MDFTKLKRDEQYIDSNLFEQKTGELVTKKPLRIMFPSHYLDGKLGYIEEDIHVVGIFALIMEDKYSVSKTFGLIGLTPDDLREITIEDVKYTELSFLPGSVVAPSLNMLQDPDIIYQVYDEIVAKGKNPWYLSYFDNSRLFDHTKEDTGAALGISPSLLSIYAAARARQEKDRTKYYRELLKSQSDVEKINPVIIPARSVAFGATNTTARLAGSYLKNEGIVASLVYPSKESESVEELLRS